MNSMPSANKEKPSSFRIMIMYSSSFFLKSLLFIRFACISYVYEFYLWNSNYLDKYPNFTKNGYKYVQVISNE